MNAIGGNTTATIQTRSGDTFNELHERIPSWTDKYTLTGWMDLQSGEARHTQYGAKVEESTHVFLCDWQDLSGVTPGNSRLSHNGSVYEILLIDDPMGLHYHLEVSLRYIGGQV